MLNIKEKSFGQRNIGKKQEIVKSGWLSHLLEIKVGTCSFEIRWYEQIDWTCAMVSEETITEGVICSLQGMFIFGTTAWVLLLKITLEKNFISKLNKNF